jgi:hypothetical protein
MLSLRGHSTHLRVNARLALIFGALLSTPGFSQTTATAPAPDSPAAPKTTQEPASPVKSKPKDGGSKDRLLFALPNFQTVEDGGKLPPMTAGQKYKLVVRSAFDPVQYPWYAMLAGIGQAENTDPSYGQGAEGYAKRYATNFGDGVTENFMVGAVFPSLLHQDPRFYQTSKGTFMHRLGYAMSRILVTRSDSGAEQFNYSEILGSTATATLVSYAYHPRDDRKLSSIATTWATQVGYDTLTCVTREFWPDLRRKIKRK